MDFLSILCSVNWKFDFGYIVQHKGKHGAAITWQWQHKSDNQHDQTQQRNQQAYFQTLSQLNSIQTAPLVFYFAALAVLATFKLLSSGRITISYSIHATNSKKTIA